MLTADTKRRIDSARQVLVGVVPDPKSQIDQITNALIYKFMDDMDRSSVRAGGRAAFFVGDLKPFAWTRLMDARLGNQERLNLYAEALAKFSSAEQLPTLFREIFQRAVLPYRDPEVLGLFLKEIDGFTYDNSEELGNAFEYLLSVMGSQGDAGQFRTPRHIIDFIVAVIAPAKDETVLDPACGTAGFLISAFKFIMARHRSGKEADGRLNDERALLPQERKQLMANFTGYDISPDMVRLSRVNMYLHGFPQPNIIEYDTLTSDARWGDKFDVILANPPFMSPKGGIRPHNKFQIQASRSEVLFVDYIMTHLKPRGRAGVIVPEGVVFQSGTSHRQLRKLLVEDGLYAVVSLPPGVFNPYSGVKTSVLFFDREVAKRATDILFVKIEADGFDLGAQRRPNQKNDLPEALKILRDYRELICHSRAGGNPETPVIPAPKIVIPAKAGIQKETTPTNTTLSKLSLLVPKSKIAADGDFNLTGDRYRETTRPTSTKWPMVKLGEVCEINPKKSEIAGLSDDTLISFLPMEDLGQGEIDIRPKKQRKLGDVRNGYTYFMDGDVLFAKVTPCFENKKAGLAQGLSSGIGFGSSEYIILRANDRILPEILYHVISSQKFIDGGRYQMTGTGGLKRLARKYVEEFQFGLPPLEIQKEIAAELDGYQHIIHGAKEIIANWKPTIEANPEWEVRALGQIAEIEYGYTDTAKNIGEARFIRITDIDENGELKDSDKKYINLTDDAKKYILQKDDVLVARTGATYGKTMLFDGQEKAVFASFLIRINLDKTKILPEYYWAFTRSSQYWTQANSLVTGGGQPQFNGNALKQIKIPLPPLDIQREIVMKFEKERACMEMARFLVNAYESKSKTIFDHLNK